MTAATLTSMAREARGISVAVPARSAVAALALALILTLPLLATLVVGTFRVNLTAGAGLIVAAITLGLRFDRRLLETPARQVLGGVLISLGVFIAAWQWQVGNLWLNSQVVLYTGCLACFIALTAWFRQSGADGVRLAFELKLGAVIGSSLVMLAGIWSLPDDPGALLRFLANPPVYYHHIRHFNYDQLPAIAIAVCLAAQARPGPARVAWFALLAAMGFLLAWSGGRGVMISLGIFVFLSAAFRILSLRSILFGIGALAVGALLVFAVGQGDLLVGQLSKFSGSADVVASRRLGTWLSAVNIWRDGWLSVVFGFGPDAMRTAIRPEMGFPAIVQIHNGFLHVLIEFGIVGLGVFVAAIWFIARRALRILAARSAPREARISAALLVAFGAYMLVDGILYHAMPLIMVMLLTACLYSVDAGTGNWRRSNDAAPPSPPPTGPDR